MDNNLYSAWEYTDFEFVDDNNEKQVIKLHDIPKKTSDFVLYFQNRNVSRKRARQLKKDLLKHIYSGQEISYGEA